MTEKELQQYLQTNYPKENDSCEWKEFKNLKNSFYGKPGDDVVSYVSAISNMGGIRKLYIQQKKRFFPMPEYDTSAGTVVCKIQGKVLDENFAKILVNNPELNLSEIMLLDKVQKHLPISDDTLTLFRKKGYIEGRKPNVYLSAKIARGSKHAGLKSEYIKNRSFDDAYFKKLIIEYIGQYGKATRKEIVTLLYGKLSDALTDSQKVSKIANMLTSLRKDEKICLQPGKIWVLAK